MLYAYVWTGSWPEDTKYIAFARNVEDALKLVKEKHGSICGLNPWKLDYTNEPDAAYLVEEGLVLGV